ncbi:cyclic nucleotide-binding domain-containing protein [bacterium]|nr:cyclic nucleotide-binding domain-containing protein [bacterium]
MLEKFMLPEDERNRLLRELTTSFFFSDFTEEELSLLLECAQPIDFDPGDFIFKEGDIGVHFYVILEGRVEIRKEKSGRLLATLGQGKVFGEMAVLENQLRSAAAISATSIRLIAIEGRRLMEDYPHLTVKLLRNLARELSDKLREANQVIDSF